MSRPPSADVSPPKPGFRETECDAPGRRLVLGFLTGLVLIVVLFPLLRVGLVVNDDLQLSVLAYRTSLPGYVSNQYDTLLTHTGRANFGSLVWQYLPFAFRSAAYFKVVALGSLLAALLAVALLVHSLTESAELALLALLVGAVGLQNSWEHTPVTAFPGMFSFPLTCLVLSMAALVRYRKGGRRALLSLSVAGYVLALASYEAFVLYGPVLALIALGVRPAGAPRDPGERWRAVIPFAAASLGYLLLYALFRSAHGSDYGGVKVQAAGLRLHDVVATLLQLTASAVPTYFFWDSKYRYLFGSHYVDSPAAPWGTVPHLSVEPEWILKGLCVAVVAFLVLRGARSALSRRASAACLAVAGACVFLPGVLPALTKHYQDAVLVNGQKGMPVSFFSFLALVALVTLGLSAAADAVPRPRGRNVLAALAAVGLAGAGFVVDNTNGFVARAQVRSQLKWEVVDRFLDTPEWAGVPAGSVIYAPTLWNRIGSVAVHDGYWSDYFELRGGKRVNVVSTPGGVEDAAGGFLLKFDQLAQDGEQFLVFGPRRAREGRALRGEAAGDATVLVYSKYVSFSLVGRLEGASAGCRLTANEREARLAGSTFQAKLGAGSYAVDRGGLKRVRLRLDGNCPAAIDVASIAFLPESLAGLDFLDAGGRAGEAAGPARRLSLGSGWFAPEGGSRWVGKSGGIRVSAGGAARLVVEGLVPREILERAYGNSVTVTLVLDGKPVAEQGMSGESEPSRQFRLVAEIPPGGEAFAELRVSKSFVPARTGLGPDVRELAAVVTRVDLPRN